jgi:phage gpG-like protein
MAVSLRIQVSQNDVQAAMFAMEVALSPVAMMGFMTTRVEPIMRRRISERFMSEGDSAVGGKWMELKPSTVAFREESGFPGEHPINQRTGELFQKLTNGTNAVTAIAGGAAFMLPGPVSGEMEEKLSTAQEGKMFPATVPRPVLGLDAQDMISVMTALALYVEGAVQGGIGGAVAGSAAVGAVA